MNKDNELLLICRHLIEQSVKWGDSRTWSNDDFEQLSKLIFEKTKVQLSLSTLKRIWGKVRYESRPTTATLNTLARFVDYGSWRELGQQYPTKEVAEELVPVVDLVEHSKIQTSKFYRYAGIVCGISLVLLCSYLFTRQKRLREATATLKFSSRKVSDELPNSVVFQYDVSGFNADSVFIQQSWDPARRERVPDDGKTYTSIYYRPGYFQAKLIVDHEIKKETVVFIKTKGWKGIIDKKPVPVYLSKEETIHPGYLGIADTVMQQKNGSPILNDTWVKFSNVREFQGIDAGNFTLETTLRNTSTAGVSVCAKTNLVILGTGKAIVVPLSRKGCIADIGLLTGERWIDGKDHDLSAFGCDFSQFQLLKCRVKDHHLNIFLNGKTIFDIEQKQSIGRVVGIRFEFEGSGQVKQVKLESPGSPAYEDRF
ncbi:MAG: hypothetical protein EOP45_02530 [Sphingobacteriaceae bacterium]|nr:MAG: hypothetical protein EOP45_02530 [Sphingobacteriaceae bacterium]